MWTRCDSSGWIMLNIQLLTCDNALRGMQDRGTPVCQPNLGDFSVSASFAGSPTRFVSGCGSPR